MNSPGRRYAEQLATAGLDPLEVPAKSRLYDSVLSTFARQIGGSPDHVAWVPGRLEVFGTHTDYAGGRTLVCALPRGFAFGAKRRLDGQVRVIDAISDETMVVDCSRPSIVSGWRHYVNVVVNRLARNFPNVRLGADIVFASDLPRAAGMSSSSALIVGIATTLVRVAGIRSTPDWHAHVGDALAEAGYYACIENGRTFGVLAGDAGVGTHGGSEDHAAMLCGEPGALTALAFAPMRQLDSVRLPANWRVVVASSGVAAEKTGTAMESYNRLARGAEQLLSLWNQKEIPAASLASALASDASAPARLGAILRSSTVPGWPPDALEARLQHFVREDARVPEAVIAFGHPDARALAVLAENSQSDADTLLRNQVPETATLTRLAITCGAFAARNFGAGFGGSVWATVEQEDATEVLQRWSNAYRNAYPERTHALAFLAQPAPRVTELAT